MKIYKEQKFTGERALFMARDIGLRDCVFCDGESPLKESSGVVAKDCIFGWKYPLWYSKNAELDGCTLLVGARSGIWYTEGIELVNCTVDAPKTFRRSSGIKLTKVTMPNAQESLWSCSDIELYDVSASGDYFGMNSCDIVARGLNLSGNYAFDGGRNIEVHNSRLISKDAFWNCENVTVYDSVIIGEYLGWNSKNVTLVNCTVESNQGLCYMENVRLVNCKLINTDLAFEYSSVEADISSSVLSVKNPLSGRICAESFGEIILDGNGKGEGKCDICAREGNGGEND